MMNKYATNKNIIQKVVFVFLFLISLNSLSQSNFYSGALTQGSWDILIAEINTKKVSLESKITQAQGLPSPLETSYAEGTVVTVDEFLKYAARDKQNATVLQNKYENNPFAFWNGLWENHMSSLGFYTPTPDFSVHNPFQQLHDCVKILDRAINEIDNQLAGNIVLAETLDFTTSGYPTLPVNNSYYMKDGNVIFPSTFWGLRDDNLDVLETLGYLGEVFHSAGQTTTGNYNGDPNAIIATPNFVNGANGMAARLSNQVGNNQTPTQIQMTHTNLSSAITTKYPGIGDNPKAFVHYDIDHPEIRNMNESIISTFVPQLVTAASGSPLIYVLSNEPHWDISEGQASNGVSANTYNAYVEHLKTEYSNDINALNSIYNPFNSNQNFTNFDALKSTYTIPLNKSTWQGTPIWYDWMRFNMNRSNRWHQDLKDIVRDNDPSAKVSIKLLGRELEDPRRDGGIDLETLIDLQDILGFDNQVVPNETHGRNNRFYTTWLNDYIMDWREQSMMLDFCKSLYPNKPTFDSEWHGHSSNAYNNHALDESYTRAALWMAFSNGLSVINNWWWYRDSNGDLLGKTNATGNTMFSPQHQAVAFDEFGRTLKELNAHSNTVATLIPEKRDYLLYYSNEAAIQDWNYVQHLAIIYEALKLLNVKVGFTTESKIGVLGYTPKAIIIPPTMFIKDSSMDALNAFETNNPTADIFQINRFNAAQQNFIKDEKGVSDGARDASFVNKSTTFTTDIPTLISRLRAQLSFPSPSIDFDITLPGTSTEAFGVFASQGKTPDNKNVISLINVSLEDREIQLSESVINLLTGEIVNATHVMKPYDVLLITDNSTLSSKTTETNTKPYMYYPNPVSDILTIKNSFYGEYNMYNITGAHIKTIESVTDTIEIRVGNLSSGIYFLEIPTANGKQIEKIIINR